MEKTHSTPTDTLVKPTYRKHLKVEKKTAQPLHPGYARKPASASLAKDLNKNSLQTTMEEVSTHVKEEYVTILLMPKTSHKVIEMSGGKYSIYTTAAGAIIVKLRRMLRWSARHFFLRFPQFESLRPLQKLVRRRTKPLPDEESHGLAYSTRIMQNKNDQFPTILD